MKSLYDAIKSMGYSLKYIKSIQVLSEDMATGYIDSQFNDIIDRVGQFSEGGTWGNDSYRYLKNAITEGRVEFAVAINSDELLSVGAFSIEGIDHFIMSKMPEQFPRVEKFLYLKWLTGNGKGGGVAVIHELMQIAESAGLMLFLNATTSSKSFYESVGFEKSLDPAYYYWLPSSIRQVAKTG